MHLENGQTEAMQAMAENQVFLSDAVNSNLNRIWGLASPRFNNRYPKWPTFQEMDRILDLLEESRENLLFAPQVFSISRTNFRNWLRLQNYVHPGMQAILEELCLKTGVYQNLPKKGFIVMGNTFFASADLRAKFLDNWMKFFREFQEDSKRYTDFKFRCIKCGIITSDGIGRWRNNRLPAYLMERFTAISFFQLGEIDLLKMTSSKVKKRRAFNINYFSQVFLEIYSLANRCYLKISKKACTHSYFQPGKL